MKLKLASCKRKYLSQAIFSANFKLIFFFFFNQTEFQNKMNEQSIIINVFWVVVFVLFFNLIVHDSCFMFNTIIQAVLDYVNHN